MADQYGIKSTPITRTTSKSVPPEKKKQGKKTHQNKTIKKSDSIGTLPTFHNDPPDSFGVDNHR
jgi:hypothetical protein